VSLVPDDGATPAATTAAAGAVPTASSTSSTLRAALIRREIVIDAIVPTILLRVVVLVYALLAVIVLESDAQPAGSVLEIWNRWDAPHFIEVAQSGYADPARIVLFPLLPALIRLGSLVTQPLVAGMVISFVGTLAAAAGLHRLVRMDENRSTARWAVLAMCLFPTAFTLVAPYSEGPFLAFTVWSFVAARERRWPAAGAFALLAGLTRIQGAFLLPALIVEYWLTERRVGRDASWLLLAAGGTLIYLAINYVTFGDPLYFIEIQRTIFKVSTIAPWVAIANAWNGVMVLEPSRMWATVFLAPFLAICVLAATTLWTIFAKASRPSYAVYTALTLLSFLTLSWPISVPRYLMGVFTIFIAAGGIFRRPSIGPPVFVASVLLFGLSTALFVTGHWAF
jgi:Mannosyltransferase (PIG-V)